MGRIVTYSVNAGKTLAAQGTGQVILSYSPFPCRSQATWRQAYMLLSSMPGGHRANKKAGLADLVLLDAIAP